MAIEHLEIETLPAGTLDATRDPNEAGIGVGRGLADLDAGRVLDLDESGLYDYFQSFRTRLESRLSGA